MGVPKQGGLGLDILTMDSGGQGSGIWVQRCAEGVRCPPSRQIKMGAAKVLALRFEDIDWQAGILKARRPKTKVLIESPLPASGKSMDCVFEVGTVICQSGTVYFLGQYSWRRLLRHFIPN